MSNVIEESYNTTTQGTQQTGVMQIRLYTGKLVEDIEMYLTGQVTQLVDTENGQQYLRIQKARPKANPEGVHGILTMVQSFLNPQVVQGNFLKHEDFERFIYNMRRDFAEDLMIKMPEWDVSDTDYPFIMDFIMNMAEPFLSRLIKNRERESYGEAMRVIEHSTTNQDSKGFGLFKGKPGGTQ